MKVVRIFMGSLVILSVLAIALAEDKKPATGPAKPPKPTLTPAQLEEKRMRDDYSRMAETAGMSDDQRSKLTKAITEHLAVKNAWKAKNEPLLTELNKKMADARSSGDKDAETAIKQQLKPLYEQKDAIWSQERKLGFALMTDAQRLKWESSLLQKEVLRNYKGVEFTKDQKNTIAQICNTGAAEVIALSQDRHKISKVRRRLKLETYSNIMSAWQRTEFEAGKLVKAATQRYRRAKLDDEQTKKLDALAKKFGQIISTSMPRRTKRGLHERFLLEVFDNILSKEQQTKVPPPKQRRKPRPAARRKSTEPA